MGDDMDELLNDFPQEFHQAILEEVKAIYAAPKHPKDPDNPKDITTLSTWVIDKAAYSVLRKYGLPTTDDATKVFHYVMKHIMGCPEVRKELKETTKLTVRGFFTEIQEDISLPPSPDSSEKERVR